MTPLPPPGDSSAAYFFDLQGMLYPFWSAQGPWAARKLVELVRRVFLDQRPAYVAFAGDLPFPTFRHDLAADLFPPDKLYKGDRRPLDPAKKAQLLEQLRIAEELLADLFGIRTLKVRGYEADDVLASLAALAVEAGLKVVVVGVDRDLMQLVDEPRVVLWDGRVKVTGKAGVVADLKVRPEQVADYFAIVGGKNNIPGVKGLGEVAAREILTMFPTIEAALAHAEQVRETAFPRHMVMKLLAGAQDARDSLRLARLDRAVPLPAAVADLRALPFIDWERD